jgi:2-phospho-L-lactate guanylyltransferase (CobY/MobA/RfbA family)
MKRPAWAIVPAKSLGDGKSRLRPILGDEDRARFAQRLLEHVLAVLAACSLDGVLVATGGDVGALFAALDDLDVVLVPDHLGHHTNALAIAPPTAMTTCFGRADSFAAHCAAAHAAGLRVAVVESERVAFDVDLPADHQRLMAPRPAAGT